MSLRRTAALALTALVLPLAVTTPLVAEGAPPPTGHPDAAIQRHLDRLVSRHGFPGATATVRGSDGRVRTYRAGVGDLETGEPIARDMDGRVLAEAFDDRFSRGTSIPVVETFEPEGPQ